MAALKYLIFLSNKVLSQIYIKYTLHTKKARGRIYLLPERNPDHCEMKKNLRSSFWSEYRNKIFCTLKICHTYCANYMFVDRNSFILHECLYLFRIFHHFSLRCIFFKMQTKNFHTNVQLNIKF